MKDVLNHETPPIVNILLAAGFIPVDERKPPHYIDGQRNWVLATWSENGQEIKVFADEIGTDNCTADYWRSLETCT